MSAPVATGPVATAGGIVTSWTPSRFRLIPNLRWSAGGLMEGAPALRLVPAVPTPPAASAPAFKRPSLSATAPLPTGNWPLRLVPAAAVALLVVFTTAAMYFEFAATTFSSKLLTDEFMLRLS